MKKLLTLLLLSIFSCSTESPLLQKKLSTSFFNEANPITLGCYYYPEQWPEEEWNRDLKNLSSMGFEFTHFGEFAWALLEPEEGKFNFEWLDKAIDLAAKNKLKVILCTPSAAPPVWLVQKYPEILMQNDDGKTMQHGSRQQGSWSSKIYRKYIQKIVTELAKRYGNDQRVWGWQLDNEPSHYGFPYDYNAASQDAFVQWLMNKYQNIDSLNLRWGNNFWSQRYSDFPEIRIPNAKELVQPANPHALLDFQEFTNQQRGVFLREQASALRQIISSQQFITSNYMMQMPHSDPWVNKNDLDFASYTNYPVNSYSEVDNGDLGFRLGSGRDLALTHDFHQSVNGVTGIMELQPGQVNWGHYNAQPQPGAVRMWAWHTFALGAKFICTYRYRQPLSGNEQYHQGIMQTDGVTLSRGGSEYAQAIKEMNDIKKVFKADSSPQQKVAIWWDQRSMLDMYNFPHNRNWSAVSELYRYYESIKSFALPVEFINAAPDPKHYPVLLIPSIQLVDDAMIAQWKKYVEAGGTLIITPRSGQKNRDGHLWKMKNQEKIKELVGASILFNDHLPASKKAQVTMNNKTYEWNSWGEIVNLQNDSASVKIMATYSDQFYQGKAACVSNSIGKGKVFYIGISSTTGDFEKEILKEAFLHSKLEITELPKYIYQEKRGNLTITVNYSSEEFELKIPEGSKIVLGEKVLKPGEVTVWME
ncbi:MAG: beta-galactosidase [Bacteroidetes bacterium]|nr:beta-galactosidase [Bacteroidota bacterium]